MNICSVTNIRGRCVKINPPTSSYAIMRRVRPNRGENRGPGKGDGRELDSWPGIREQPRPKRGHSSWQIRLSINPAQTSLYLLSNRVGSPIRYGSGVRRESSIRGDLAKWSHACYGRRINAHWARSAWIEIAFNSRIENISSIANSDSRWSLRHQKRVIARLKHLPKWQIRITRVAREVLCCHSKWKSL